MKSKLLVYDSFYSGHHREYVEHLLRHWPADTGVIFVVHPKVIAEINSIGLIHNFELVGLPQVLADELENVTNHKEHLAVEREFILEIAQQYQPAEWLWLFMDPYRTFLGSRPFRGLGIRHRGILFMNQLYVPWNLGYLRQQLAYRLKLWLLLRNPAVEEIYILNDQQGSQRLNQKYRTERFSFLPDPVLIIDSLGLDQTADQGALRASLGWSKDRKIALLFGAISERKNALGCLRAASCLPPALRARTCLVIHASSIRSPHKEQLSSLIAEINESYPELELRFERGRLSDQELAHRIAASDLILAPYRHFYSSSGVMNCAIRHAKPFVASERGLMAVLAREYGVGQLVDPTDFEQMATAWEEGFKEETLPLDSCERYINARSAEEFAGILGKQKLGVGA